MISSHSLKDRTPNLRTRALLESALQPLEQRMLLSTVSVANATANEGSPLLFTISLNAAASTPITVNYSTANKTAKAGSDYTATKGAVTFAAGQTSQTVSVNTIDNQTFGPALSVDLKLSKPTKGVSVSPSFAVGTIDNIDAQPTLTVTNAVPVGSFSKGTKTATFTITENGKSTSPVSVNYATEDVTTTAGTDYIARSGTAKFSGKKDTFGVKVKIKPDTNLTEDKDFLLQLSAPSNATLGTASYGVGVIGTTGTTTGATLSVTPSTTVAPGAPATLTVSLSEVAADPVTVNYVTTDGTGASGTDYTAATGTLTFPVGATTQTITVPTLASGNGGTVGLILSSPTNAAITVRSSVITIIPTLSIGNITVSAPATGTAVTDFTVMLSNAIAQPVTVNYATSDGTAIAGTNYTAAIGTLTIPADTTSATIPVTILTSVATSKTFTITLSSPSNATLATRIATATIENPSTIPSISVNSPTIDEPVSGGTTADFTVTLSATSSLPVQINYATQDDSAIAGTNYTAASGTLTIPAGVTSEEIQVPVLGNVSTSADFLLDLSSPVNATLATTTASATISNTTTTLPSLAISDLTIDQATSGSSTAYFMVGLSAGTTQDVQFNYATSDGTATAGTNYTAASGTLTIPAGSVTAQVPVTILGNVASSGTFTVTISAAVDATISDASATGTIVNTAAALPTLAIADVSEDEGTGANSTFDFPVTLSAPSSATVTVNYATADGTINPATGERAGSTDPDGDYYSANGTLTFLPGTTTQDIAITVIGDSTVENDETFTVTLSDPSGATLSGAAATGTILNDDTTEPTVPALTVNDAAVAQASGGSTAAFVVSLTSPATQNVTVAYATSDGTAVAGQDYTAAANILTFTPGQTSQIIDVPVVDDTSVTTNSVYFTLNLSSPSGATLADASATGTIYNSNGIAYDNSSTGFASTNTHGSTDFNSFDYSITSTRTTDLADAQIQFFLGPENEDLDSATPFRVADIGTIAAGQTVTGSIDLSGAPQQQTSQQYYARLVSSSGTVIIVYDVNMSVPIIEEPG